MHPARATDVLLQSLFKSSVPSTDVLAALVSLKVPIDWLSNCPSGSGGIHRERAGSTLFDYAMTADMASGGISGLIWSTMTAGQPIDIHASRSWPDNSKTSMAQRAMARGYWPLLAHWLNENILSPDTALEIATSSDVMAKSLEPEWWSSWSMWSGKSNKKPISSVMQSLAREWIDHRAKYLWLTVKAHAELIKTKPTSSWDAHDAAVWLSHVCSLGHVASWQWGVLVSKPDQPKQTNQTNQTTRSNTSRPWTLISPEAWISALSQTPAKNTLNSFGLLPYAAECIRQASGKLGGTCTKDTWEAMLQAIPLEQMPRPWILDQLSKNTPSSGSPNQFCNLLTHRLLTAFVDHPQTPANWDSVRALSSLSLFSVLGPFHKKMVSWTESVVANTTTYPWHLPPSWWTASTTSAPPNAGKILASAVLAVTPDVLMQEAQVLETWINQNTASGTGLLKSGDIERLADASAVALQRCGNEVHRPILAQLLWVLVLKCPSAKQTEWLTKMANAHINTPDKNRLRVLYELPNWSKLLPEVLKIPKSQNPKVQSYLDQLVLTNSVATPTAAKVSRRM